MNWEYMAITADNYVMAAVMLNEWTNKGWELLNLFPITTPGHFNKYEIFIRKAIE